MGTLLVRRLEASLGGDHGIRAPPRTARGEAFVEGVLTAFPSLAFDLLAARAQVRMWAELASAGIDVNLS